MKHNFCTLLSRDYLYKGLVLYNSLLKHDNDFTLFIFCMEEELKHVMEHLNLKNAFIIDIADLEAEDAELLETKANRSTQEYSWTAKASVMLYIFRHYGFVDNIIWLDGDTAFFSNTEPIYQEWKDYSIILTEEKYTGPYEEKSRIYGKYQLGFMGFKKDNIGISCLEWFRSKVIEWCFNRFEKGLWADQMYACNWPETFNSVCVVKHKGINANPFILYRYTTEQGMKIIKKGSKVFIDDEEVVLFHFYGFDYYNSSEFDLCHYGSFLSDDTLECIYKAYVESVNIACKAINAVSTDFYKERELKGHSIKNYFNLPVNMESSGTVMNYCTFTSSEYLTRCLALLQSLNSCAMEFRLWVCCLDEKAYDTLNRLHPQNTTLVDSRCIEDEELKKVREYRCIKEYAYTAKGTFISYLMKNNYNLKKIVYADADIFFYSGIKFIFDILDSCSVVLVKNRSQTANEGNKVFFNSSLIGFSRNHNTFIYLDKWKYSSLWYSQKGGEFSAESYKRILNNWHFKLKGIKVISTPTVLLESKSRICFKLKLRDGKPVISNQRLMAMHFNTESLENINHYDYASTLEMLLQDYSKLIDSMESRVQEMKNQKVYKVEVDSVNNDSEGYCREQVDEIKDLCGKFFRGKKIAVTGANGFIGSRLVKRLVGYGANVHIMVREASDLWRIENLLADVTISRTDMRIPEIVTECVRAAKPEYIFHMAAYGVDHRQKDYIEAANTNILGTINIIEAAKASGCGKLINTGTSMQYGNKPGSIIEDSIYKPNNIYGSTKAAATILAHQIAQENEIDIATIIPFGVFGESEGSHKFFPHVILSALRGIDVELSHCEQFRDYCYVENIIDGFLLAAANKKIKNGIFNIGSGETYKLKHFVNLITEKMECSCNIKYGSIDYRKNDLWSPKPDIKKISEDLGWKPRISLEVGIEMTIEWFKDNLDKYSIKGR